MEQKEYTVGIPLYNGCTLMDFAGATQVFSTPYGFKTIWLAAESAVTTTENITVLPNYHFDYHPPIDVLFVPGGGPEGVPAVMKNQPYLDFLQKTSAAALWRGSVCTGAFVLAAAGLLKNCKATTYWSQIPTLKLLQEKMNLTIPEGYPRFLADEDSKVFTGGGISSSLDLALYLVMQIKGLRAAQEAQLFIQYEPGPPIDSGDPSVAPKAIVDEQIAASADFTKVLTEAVQALM